MREAVERLRAQDADFKECAVGIGLHTGKVVTGEISTPDKSDFTAVGSAVNLASRIEDETRRVFQSRWDNGEQPSVVILMSHVTYELVRDVIEARSIGEVTIRGLENEEVQLWELVGVKRET
jgi:adenylate cyclase